MNSENKKKIFNEMIQMVTRQTNLNYDEVKELLILNNYDYMKIIKENNGIVEKKKPESSTSINQMVYNEIRGLMDDAAKKFREKKEYQEKKEEYMQSLRLQQEMQQQSKLKQIEE
jgi:hypothetical protein